MLRKMPGSTQLVIGQIVFMVASYLMHIAITRLLGPEDYGSWGIMISLLIWFELCVMIGFPKWTTKEIAAETDESRRRQIKLVSLLGQGIAALILGSVFYLLASLFSDLLNDPGLELLLKISAFDIPLYGFYFVNFGIINGFQNYWRMSVLTAVYGLSKMSLVIVLILGGFGLTGAAVGNVLSSVVVLFISFWWVGAIDFKLDGNYRLRDFFSFGIPSTVFILGFALLHQVDFLVLKAGSSNGEIVGFYLLAMMLGKIPYFIVEATSKSLFSEMSFQRSQEDILKTGRLLNDYLNITILIFALIVTVTLVNTEELILLIFPADYIRAAPFLRVLIISNSLVGLTYLLSQTLFVFDNERLSCVLVFALLCVAFPLTWFMIRRFGPEGAALSSMIIFSVGTLIFLVVSLKRIRLRLPLKMLARIAVAAAVASLVVVAFHPTSAMGYFLKPAVSTFAFVLTLLLLREPSLKQLLKKA